MKLKFSHITGNIHFRDIFALAVLAVIALLLYTGKITATVFAAVLGVVIGYYFGKTTTAQSTATG